jgi:hypothetical protein
MSAASHIVTTTRDLVEEGTGLVDAFREALARHPTTDASRRFAARIVTIGHPRALVQLLDVIEERAAAQGASP